MARGIFVAACGMFIATCGIFSLRHVGSSSLTRDGAWPPALGAQSLNHWTTREVPGKCMFKCIRSC